MENSFLYVDEEWKNKRTREAFTSVQGERVLIYGTGIIAGRVLDAIKENNVVVGFLDGAKMSGEFAGYPILCWEDITRESNLDAIIIAATLQNTSMIYKRIMVKAETYKIKVYSSNGELMNGLYPWEVYSKEDIQYFKKRKEELLEKIEQYDAISFDLFDTLIMRKTLVPTDVFEVVERNIKKKGIEITNFKQIRREKDLKNPLGTIYDIYNDLKETLNLSTQEMEIILEEEIECEKKLLVPRYEMVDVMNLAVAQGKIVNIISDMYYPEEILKNILKSLNIKGYEKIYVSCRYKVTKQNGLFEVYKKQVKANRLLHIGDNVASDVEAAQKSGIDSYYIRSAYDMLNSSSFRGVLAWANNINERGLLGIAIADVLNDPFTMYGNAGAISISDWKQFTKMFALPIAMIYIHNLSKIVKKNNYDGIVFTARDGYFFEKILKTFINIETYYISTSRKLALSISLEKDEDIIRLLSYYKSRDALQAFLQDVLTEKDYKEFEDVYAENPMEYLMLYKEKLLQISRELRHNYKKYLSHIGMDYNKKYIICDLNASGTVYRSLNALFGVRQDGFYLYKFDEKNIGESVYHAVYDQKIKEDMNNNINKYTFFLETVFSAPHPSVTMIDENLEIKYAKETRSKEMIETMMKIHAALLKYSEQYLDEIYIPDMKISKEFVDAMLGNCERAEYIKECMVVKEWYGYDDALNEKCKVFAC